MLTEQIDQDFKVAMKAKDEIGKSSLGNVRAALKDAEISKREKLTDEETLSVIAKKVKQHKDSIEGFTKGDRADLVANETAQMEVLQKYLPKQMDESEVRKIVKETIAALAAGPSDFGKVMKEVVGKVKGQTDGSVVSKIVKEELSA
jgi:uncharacterized protein